MNATLPDNIMISQFPARPTPELWARYHAFRRERHAEVRPDDPMTPDGEVEADWLLDDPYTDEQRLIAADGERIVASAGLWRQTPANPSYDTNAHLANVGVHVIGPYRRRGIGSAMMRQLVESLAPHGIRTVSARTEFEDGHAFLNALGFAPKLVESENRLDLAALDWAMVERWAAESPARSPETRLELYEPRVPFEALETLVPTMNRVGADVPTDDLEHGEWKDTPESFARQVNDWLDSAGASHHLMCTREPDGSASGVTDLNYRPSHPDRVYQMLTGVLPEHRGRGLGKWLKAAMLLHIRDLYPEVRWVITGNANSNAPMLGINHALGFFKYREHTAYQANLNALAERLGAAVS